MLIDQIRISYDLGTSVGDVQPSLEISDLNSAIVNGERSMIVIEEDRLYHWML